MKYFLLARLVSSVGQWEEEAELRMMLEVVEVDQICFVLDFDSV